MVSPIMLWFQLTLKAGRFKDIMPYFNKHGLFVKQFNKASALKSGTLKSRMLIHKRRYENITMLHEVWVGAKEM